MIQTIKGKPVEIIAVDGLQCKQVRIRVIGDGRELWINKNELRSDIGKKEIVKEIVKCLQKK